MKITEDKIRGALNESLNEFMLEEGLGNSMLGKLGKGIWNGLKMYMDWRTGGRWNNQYGMYANGNGKTTELYYLGKWFSYHLGQIKNIAYHSQNPSRAQQEIQWTRDENGNPVGKETINNYTDVAQYVQQNVTPQNFNGWVGQYIKNRNALDCIDKYILTYSSQIRDVKSAITYLHIGSFLETEYGKEYLGTKRSELKTSNYTGTNYNNICLNALNSFDSAADMFFKGAYKASFSETGIDEFFKQAFNTQYATRNTYIMNALNLIYSYTKEMIASARGDYDFLEYALTYKEFKNSGYGKKFTKLVDSTKKAFEAYNK